MRGVAQFNFPTPVSGLLRDRPTQQVGLDGLINGSNMVLDPDGYYRPRYGYRPWLSSKPNKALIGMGSYTDTDGTNQYVGADVSQIWAVVGGIWTGQGGGLGGSPNDLVSVVPFLQPWVSGANQSVLSAIFCNNNNQMVLWNKNLTVAQPLTPVFAAGSGNTLAFNTTPTFTAYGAGPPGPTWFFTVTATNTGNVTLNINSVGAKAVMFINASGSLAQLPASYLVPGVPYNVSYDGTEFVIGTNVQAPSARAICALNDRIIAVNVIFGAQPRVPSQVAWSSAFDATSWPASAFQNLVDTDDPLIGIQKIGFSAAVVYGEQSGYLMQGVYGAGDGQAFTFAPINNYIVGPVSPLAIVPYSGGHLWLGRDQRIWTTDGLNAQPFSGAVTSVLQQMFNPTFQTQTFSLVEPRERRIYWFFQQIGQMTTSALVLSLDPQPHFESLQAYPTLFTSATEAVSQVGTTWANLTNPWSTYQNAWNAFVNAFQVLDLISDGSPQVYLIGPSGGVLDNGAYISYSYTPGLMTAGPSLDIRPESFDFFCQSASMLELATVQFDQLDFPDDMGTTILATPIDFHDPESFTQAQVFPEMTNYSRYLRMTISGRSFTRACALGGATIYCNQQGRPSV